jgi:hypothetical protein
MNKALSLTGIGKSAVLAKIKVITARASTQILTQTQAVFFY